MRFRERITSVLILAAVGSASALLGTSCAAQGSSSSAGPLPEGWTTSAPRDEIRPEFRFDPTGGRDGKGWLA